MKFSERVKSLLDIDQKAFIIGVICGAIAGFATAGFLS